MASPILIPKKSTIAEKVPLPEQLAGGEVSVNWADQVWHGKHPGTNAVVTIGAPAIHSHDELYSLDKSQHLELQNNGSLVFNGATLTLPSSSGTLATLADINTNGGASFQPDPEYLADSVSAVVITGGYNGSTVLPKSGTQDYRLQTGATGDNHFLFKPLANRWRYQFEIVGSEDSTFGMEVNSLSDGAYPWLATWPAGFTASKNPLPRLVAPLATTASDGTSAYQARADHVHPFPTALQVGAAPLQSGKIPSQYLPSYVDDVVEYETLSSLQADTAARESGKIFVVRNTGKIYRWSGGTLFVEISNSLELEDIQIPDSMVGIQFQFSSPTTATLPVTGVTNGRNSYDFGNGSDGWSVSWTGTRWRGTYNFSGDGDWSDETFGTGNTTYPWQATWSNASVARIGTYNAALAPAPLGAEAYSGVGTKAAREDHVHPLPTPADIGAAASSHTHPLSKLQQSSATNGQVATWNGTAWVPATPTASSGGGGGTELEDLQIPDSMVGIYFSVNGGDSTLQKTGTSNGKNYYSYSDDDGGYVSVVYTGSQWRAEWGANGFSSFFSLAAAGNTTYPWQATWSDASVTRIGTYDANLAPAPLGPIAYSGISTKAARADHVHPLPSLPIEIGLACSDETTAITTGTAKVTFRMPCAITLTSVRANVNTAPVGSTIIVDVNKGGTSILSTKLSIDASEKTSATAATPAVISDSALADDSEITIDLDQVGSTTAGKGLKVWLIGTR